MAKRTANGEVNRSEEIRKLLGENRKMPAGEIVSTLASRGIEVQPSLVYLVRGKMFKKRRKQMRQESAAKPANPVVLITKVKDLATQVGGMGHLRQLVEALAK